MGRPPGREAVRIRVPPASTKVLVWFSWQLADLGKLLSVNRTTAGKALKTIIDRKQVVVMPFGSTNEKEPEE